MTVATTYSSAEVGIEAPPVTVEAMVASGLPKVLIVGLPETAVRESKDRVKAAIRSSGFEFPSNRVTVNLAPADLPKSSGRYDLAIALTILAASGQLSDGDLHDYEFLGELSLTGNIRGVRGVLPAALRASAESRTLIVPQINGKEAALSQSPRILIANSLNSVVAHLEGKVKLSNPRPVQRSQTLSSTLKLSDIKGQSYAKRALTIAATGGHNLLMIGPPGTGKTMLASRLPGLIPPMDLGQSLEVASVVSVSNQTFDHKIWGVRPFRTPHHTASAAAMVGGGSSPKPGEISLSHHGVLFLDELPEYPRHVLEVLREPLESGEIWISRATQQVRYPADFQLVAAMNPCPCGYYGDEAHDCACSQDRIQRYRSKISGPLLDRIDLHVEVAALPPGTLAANASTKDLSADLDIPEAISQARQKMLTRQGKLNARLSGSEIEKYCPLNKQDLQFLDKAVSKLGISARGYFKILKIARTISDLTAQEHIAGQHVTEALGFRRLDRLGVGRL
jgi:magnesium chelatase family protein